jgi:hypothetical protein
VHLEYIRLSLSVVLSRLRIFTNSSLTLFSDHIKCHAACPLFPIQQATVLKFFAAATGAAIVPAFTF